MFSAVILWQSQIVLTDSMCALYICHLHTAIVLWLCVHCSIKFLKNIFTAKAVDRVPSALHCRNLEHLQRTAFSPILYHILTKSQNRLSHKSCQHLFSTFKHFSKPFQYFQELHPSPTHHLHCVSFAFTQHSCVETVQVLNIRQCNL